MKITEIGKLAAAASIALAMSFFISCSDIFGDSDDGDKSSSSSKRSSSSGYIYESSVMDNAFRFMNSGRLALETETRAIDVIRNWGWYGYDRYDDEIFEDEDDFKASKENFYSLKEELMTSSKGLLSIADYYSKGMKDKILSAVKFEGSGAKDCMKILLWAHDDIYAMPYKDDALEDIYNIMTQDPSCDGDWYCSYFPENYYSALSIYMSEETLEKINAINSKSEIEFVDWANTELATWAYSFWGRRYKDGVDEAAYSVLKILDKLYK